MGRILVTDDDTATLRIIAKTIDTLDVPYHLCSDGLHALDALRSNGDFDLLVTDISMPVMDGRQLIETIRSDPMMSELPIIIMSGVVSIREISDLLKKGASRFLPKPFANNDLREAIISCLGVKTGAMK